MKYKLIGVCFGYLVKIGLAQDSPEQTSAIAKNKCNEIKEADQKKYDSEGQILCRQKILELKEEYSEPIFRACDLSHLYCVELNQETKYKERCEKKTKLCEELNKTYESLLN